MYHIITDKNSIKNYGIGGKATNLFRLKGSGINVPPFVVLPQEVLIDLIPKEIKYDKDIVTFIEQVIIPKNIIDNIVSLLCDAKYFAVRSSATDEDSKQFSFAGQFESYLFVTKEHLAEKIKKVWCSLYADRVTEYRKNNSIKTDSGIAVIIQQMIDSDVAGVAFGINPVNGNTHEKLINAVFGQGHGLVSGALNADHFIIKDGIISSQIVHKTDQFILDISNGNGLQQMLLEKEKQDISTLPNSIINEIGNILDKLSSEYKAPQDIEFAVKDGTLFLLQARPVTKVQQANEHDASLIVWDNSNIIESYPGVTTPLTFSFISQSYEGAYKLFCGYMGISQQTIKQNERVFKNTLGLINGRVYYNLKTWYHMLAMAPGYSVNERFMENMMGVKERFDIPESYQLSKGTAFWRIAKMAVSMYSRFLSLPQKRKEFVRLLNATMDEYKNISFTKKSSHELMQLYLAFEQKLLNQWKAPLLNDFFAMIGYGMLQKRCKKYNISSNPNIHNDLLCGSSDIISTQPIHRCIKIATSISSDKDLKQLFLSANEKEIWTKLSENTSENFELIKRDVDSYISDFGERCIGELKLETISYTQDPARFIKVLQSYVASNITSASTSGNIEETIRKNAEQQVEKALKNKWFKKWKLNRSIKLARSLVSARENLRYERTRAFGMVREIFSAIGNTFYAEGIINNNRDIFYVTKEEIFAFIEGTSVTQNIKELISLRKKEFENYKIQAAPAERFATYGSVYHANDFYNTSRVELPGKNLQGIGCCPGIIRGKVKVIADPSEASILKGEILVTSSTDPGWVTLFASASGIITERGSVLSHSAIVSREMGKPCIVGVTGLLKTLTTGDEIQMDGGTGIITIIQNEA